MEILFCIPGGGTSSLMYMGWQKLLKDEFTIIPLEIPGRGRLREMERASSLEEIAEGMARQVCEQANGRSYGIFGYCYGGILAYEICRILAEEGKCLPEDLYLCGTSAPFEEISVTPLLSRKEHRQDLKDMLSRFFTAYLTANTVVMEQLCEKYMEALFQKYDAEKQISDITEEDLNLEKLEDGEEKLLDYIVSFANDFFRSYSEDEALMLRYCKACSSPYCLDSRITVICGGDDRIAGQNGNCWKRCCRKEFIQHTIEGNHFTLIEDMEKITSILRRKNRSDVAEQLREIWRKVLNADDSLDIEAETNFFEAGGDSLLLGLLNIMIEKQIGRKLRIETFFEHQTFGGMVRAIQAEPAV